MVVQVACPNPKCGAVSRVSEESIGRRGRCKKCGEVFAMSPLSGESGSATPRSGDASAGTGSSMGPGPPGPLNLPEQFGRYRIMRQIGRGGMGAVYLAHDTALDRPVALKVPFFSPLDGPQAIQRFEREAKAAATLDHPNLCPVHDVGQAEGIPYLTMPYIEGKTLSKILAGGRLLPGSQAVGIVRKLAAALHVAHERGVIHRDLKPGNIMVSRHRDLVIMDFGLARRGDSNDVVLTQPGLTLGTALYMAPEQATGLASAMGPPCDVYSLGVILYEMLAGVRPFEGPWSVVIGLKSVMDPDPPTKHRPDLSANLSAVCLKAIARNTADRYPSMAAFIEALDTIPAGTGNGELDASGDDQGEDSEPPIVSGLISRMTAGLFPKKSSRIAAPPPLPRRPSRMHFVATVVGTLLLGFAMAWGIFKVKTRDGMIILENLPDQAEVLVDGEKISVALPGEGKPLEIQVHPGKRGIEVKRDGFKAFGETVEIESGEKAMIQIRLEPLELPEAKRPAVAAVEVSASKFVPLFNGKNLDGWKDDLPNGSSWVVEDGKIVGKAAEGIRQGWLDSARKDFVNFRLNLRILNNGSRGGIRLRRKLGPDRTSSGYYVSYGSAGTPFGSICKNVDLPFGEPSDVDQMAEEVKIPQGEWFSLKIEVIDDRITSYLNEKKVAEFVDAESRFRSGNITLVSSASELPLICSDISIQELPADPKFALKFEPLFNGKDLNGWNDELANGSEWKVEDGKIIGRGAGEGKPGWLGTTRKDFRDFRLRLRVLSNGVVDRVRIRRSVSSDHRTSGYSVSADNVDIPIGSILKNVDLTIGERSPVAQRAEDSVVALGEWYTLEIEAVGNRITAFVNGKPVTRYVDPDGSFRTGDIALVAAMSDKPFICSEVAIHEIPTNPADTARFVPLFNGKDLGGWKDVLPNGSAWKVEGGEVHGVTSPTGEPGWLVTDRKDFANFRLRVRVRNNGIKGGIRIKRTFDVNDLTNAYVALLGASEAPIGSIRKLVYRRIFTTTPYRTIDVALANASVAVPRGEWSTIEVEVIDNRITSFVDGEQVAQYVDPKDQSLKGDIALAVWAQDAPLICSEVSIQELPDGTGTHVPAAAKPPEPRFGGDREPLAGSWHVEGDELVENSLRYGPNLRLVYEMVSDFDLKCRVRIDSGTGGFWAYFHAQPGYGPFRYFELGRNARTSSKIGYFNGSTSWGIIANSIRPIEPFLGTWYELRMVVRGSHFVGYLDNEEVFNGVDESYTRGQIGIGTNNVACRFKDILITAPDGKVLWKGLPRLPGM